MVISDNLNYSTDYKRRDIIIPILFLAILSMLDPLCYVFFPVLCIICVTYSYASIDIHSYRIRLVFISLHLSRRLW